MADTATATRRRPRRAPSLRRRLLIPVGILAVITLAVIAAPVLTPYGPREFLDVEPLTGPTWSNWFGVDELGRDLFTRILYGGRLSLTVALAGTTIAVVLGFIWGLTAALGGDTVDQALMRLADVVMSVPGLLLALVLVAAVGVSTAGLAIIVGLLLTPQSARVIRSLALNERESDYATAARAYGAGNFRLVVRELLPNMVGGLTVLATTNAARAMIIEASLSFVGLGVQPPSASWGTLVRNGYDRILNYPGYVIFPGLIIVITIWCLNRVGEVLGENQAFR